MMRTSLAALLFALAACGGDASAGPSDEQLLAAHPGGSIFVSSERFDSQVDCPVPAFLYGDGGQVARGVSVPIGPAGADGGRAVRRWGSWRYYHLTSREIGEPSTWGHLAQLGEFRAGKRVGKWTFWYPDGAMRAEGTFVDGAMDGDWQVWTAAGVLDAEHSGTYRAGKKVQ